MSSFDATQTVDECYEYSVTRSCIFRDTDA